MTILSLVSAKEPEIVSPRCNGPSAGIWGGNCAAAFLLGGVIKVRGTLGQWGAYYREENLAHPLRNPAHRVQLDRPQGCRDWALLDLAPIVAVSFRMIRGAAYVCQLEGPN